MISKTYALQFLILGVAYYAAGAIGIYYAQSGDIASLVWPSAGIALGLLLRWRWTIFPAVFLAELALTLTMFNLPIGHGLAVNVMNTLVPLVVIWGLRYFEFNTNFERSRDIFLFLAIGMIGYSLLSSVAGTLLLWHAGIFPTTKLLEFWLLWWLGDGAGVLLFAIPLMAVSRSTLRPLFTSHLAVATVALLALAIEIFIVERLGFSHGLIVLPVLAVVWIAMHTNLLVSSLAILMFTVVSSAGTLNDTGYFSRLEHGYGAHWFYIMALAVVSAVIASISIESRRRLDQQKHALFAANIGTWDFRLPDSRVYFNEVTASLLGRRMRELPERMSGYKEFTHPDDYPEMARRLTSYIRGESEQFHAIFRVRHAKGDWRWIESRGEAIERDWSGQPTRICGTHQDISERKFLEDDLAINVVRLRQAQEIAKLGHWTSNLASGELWWSPICYETFGFDPESTKPTVKLANKLIHPEDFERVLASEARALETGVHDVEHRIVRPDGKVRWVHELATLERDADGQPYRMVGTVQDVTAYKELELALRRQALVDELTQVPNRRYMMQHIEAEWRRFQRYQTEPSSFIMLDIDHFKKLNDTHGHGFGDDVLKAVAGRVAGLLRDVDVLARMGGEEFAILLPNTDLVGAEKVADKLRKAITELDLLAPDAAQPDVQVSASFGVAEFAIGYKDYDAIMVAADDALYVAKNSGRNQVQVAPLEPSETA